MLVLSAPSGAGKTSLAARLLETVSGLEPSVSVTTRAPRADEADGRDYIFVDRRRFAAMVRDAELLEHATVFGNGYGTPREPVERALAAGRDLLFDIDWQGAGQLRAAMERHVVTVFVLPPSAGELRRRLTERRSDADEAVRHRLATAGDELEHCRDYDYVLVNDDIETSVNGLRAILCAERLKTWRWRAQERFVEDMRNELGEG